MNKNKLAVMFITFLVLIAITPFIFSKLMNAKYNKMLNQLRQKGLVIKVVEDKSTYLTTDKILDVTIPAEVLDLQNVAKSVRLKVETKFKNLPVTNVVFLNDVEEVKLLDSYAEIQKDVNEFFKNHVKFVVTTPNFRDYAYRFNDIDIKKDFNAVIKNIKGTLSVNDIVKNRFFIQTAYIKQGSQIIEIKSIKGDSEGNDKTYHSNVTFNVNVNLPSVKVQVNDVTLKSYYSIDKKTNVIFSADFNKLLAKDVAQVENFKFKFSMKKVDTEALEELSKNSQSQEALNRVFEKGLCLGLTSSVKSAEITKQDLGGYDLTLSADFLPTKDFAQKIESKNIDFLNLHLHFVSSAQIANLIMNVYPQSAFLFALAKKENGNVELNLDIKKGRLYSNGQLVE